MFLGLARTGLSSLRILWVLPGVPTLKIETEPTLQWALAHNRVRALLWAFGIQE